MPLRQDRVVLAAHVVAESAWVFALAGIVGALAGFDSSPLSWYGVAGILGLSVFLSRITPRKRRKGRGHVCSDGRSGPRSGVRCGRPPR